MNNPRLLSTFVGTGIILGLLIGVSLLRSLTSRKDVPAEAPPYVALHA